MKKTTKSQIAYHGACYTKIPNKYPLVYNTGMKSKLSVVLEDLKDNILNLVVDDYPMHIRIYKGIPPTGRYGRMGLFESCEILLDNMFVVNTKNIDDVFLDLENGIADIEEMDVKNVWGRYANLFETECSDRDYKKILDKHKPKPEPKYCGSGFSTDLYPEEYLGRTAKEKAWDEIGLYDQGISTPSKGNGIKI